MRGEVRAGISLNWATDGQKNQYTWYSRPILNLICVDKARVLSVVHVSFLALDDRYDLITHLGNCGPDSF